MKSCFPITLCALAFRFACPPVAAADEGEALARIRTLYAATDGAKPLDSRELKFELENEPMSDSITTRRYENGLSAVRLSYVAGDHGGGDEHYYYGPDGLFFVLKFSFSWRFGPPSADGESTTIDRLVENRYYFRDGSCFHALTREGEGAGTEEKALKDKVSKLPNKPLEPGDEATTLFKRALALKGLSTGKEASAYFAAEGEAP